LWLLAVVAAVAVAGAVVLGLELTSGRTDPLSPSPDSGTTHMPAPDVQLPVPDLIGLSADQARLELTNDGLRAEVQRSPAGNSVSVVVSQSPKANVMVKAGDTIAVFLGPPK